MLTDWERLALGSRPGRLLTPGILAVLLAEVLPRLVAFASQLTLVPWRRCDLGPGSPGRQLVQLRAGYDELIDQMIDARLGDANTEARGDVMSMLLQAR